ncbi:hypothetical protein Q8F55_001251 [Vanrija albida]|uniref:NTF2 domain-containing protein n=1 Tax=Vanrija albida TaxID=181172 RepID=A0ABR3QFZ5_9TREE
MSSAAPQANGHPTSTDSANVVVAPQSTSKIQPSDVGWQFVPQYYNFVNKQPHRLHCFYNKRSTFVHGEEGEDTTPALGQQEIHERIVNLGFDQCKVYINSIDSQSSAGGGILIQVLGEMSNANKPWRKFAQTFFLAEQPNGYFVLNDIFRYLKEDTDEEEEAEDEKAAIVTPEEPAPAYEAAPAAPVVAEKPTQDTVEEVAVPEPEPVAEEPVKEPVKEAEPEPTPAPVEEAAAPEPEPAVEEPVTPAPAPVAEEPVAKPAAPAANGAAPAAAAPAAPAAPAKPKSWATLAAGGTKSWSSIASNVAAAPAAAAPAPVKKAEPAPTPAAAPAAAAPAAPAAATPAAAPAAAAGARSPYYENALKVNTAHCFVKLPNWSAQEQQGQETIDENTLRNIASRFGDVVKVEIVKGKACAFVEFAKVESARKAIIASLSTHQGGEGGVSHGEGKLNFETRKEKDERGPKGRRGGAPEGGAAPRGGGRVGGNAGGEGAGGAQRGGSAGRGGRGRGRGGAGNAGGERAAK